MSSGTFWTIMIALFVGFTAKACVASAQSAEYPNKISLLGGYGPDGLEITGGGRTVVPFMAPLWGLEYERLIWDRWSASVEVLTGTTTATKTFVGAAGAGWSF